MRRMYKGNSAATTLSGGIAAGVTSLTVTTGGGAGFPDATLGPFIITVNLSGSTEEKILVGARSGDTFSSLTRGYDGTTAAAHVAGETIRHTISAVDMDEANAHINDTTRDDHPQYGLFRKGIASLVGAASRAGRVYYKTDVDYLTYDDGAALHDFPSKAVNDLAYQPINAAAPAKTYRLAHTFTISGLIAVPSGATNYIPPFFISLPTGQTAVVAKTTHRVRGGTSATWTISHGAVDAGTAVTGLATIASTTTTTSTAATGANTLADGDAVQLVITAISGAPDNLSVTVFLDVTK